MRRLPRTVARDELLSDAYLGWLESKQHFDPQRGVPLNGFAYRRVIGAMQDGLRSRYRPVEAGKRDERADCQPTWPACNDVPWRRLPTISRLIVQLHYFEGVELKTIAGIFACSQARVSQMHQAALTSLRAMAK